MGLKKVRSDPSGDLWEWNLSRGYLPDHHDRSRRDAEPGFSARGSPLE